MEYSLAGTEAAKVFNAMAALGIIAFTFGAHCSIEACRGSIFCIQCSHSAQIGGKP